MTKNIYVRHKTHKARHRAGKDRIMQIMQKKKIIPRILAIALAAMMSLTLLQGGLAIANAGDSASAAWDGTTVTQSPQSTITFAVTPSAAQITVTHPDAGTQTPSSGGNVYILNDGNTYDYRIKSKGYITQTGAVAVNGDETITITLVPGVVWDGTVATAFSGGDGTQGNPYKIADGEELAYLSSLLSSSSTNSTYRARYYQLVADINLGGAANWTPIGTTTTNYFGGNFDGAGHAITGLRIEASGTDPYGLFGAISGGTVKNLTVGGTINSANTASSTSNGVGGIAGTFTGTNSLLENCINKVNVTAGENVGGLVGLINGSAAKTIRNCANLGSIRGTNNVGGLAGYFYYRCDITFSYNRGEVYASGSNGRAGGLSGYMNDSNANIKNCYTTGAVSGTQNVGAAVGQRVSGTVTDCFALDTLAQTGYVAGTSFKDAAYMKSADFVYDLGGDFIRDADGTINDGYPIFGWQNPSAMYEIRLTVTPANATVIFGLSGGAAIAPDTTVGGAYLFGGLAPGIYEYAVSEDDGDYVQTTGSITINYGNASRNIALAKKTYAVAFSATPADASVSITEPGYEQSKTAVGGSASFALPMGTYAFSVSKFGFIGQMGSVTVAKDAGAGPVTVNLVESASYAITFNVNIADAAITVAHPTAGFQTPASGSTYNLYSGNTYNYTVKSRGYVTQKGTITVGGSDDTITVTLIEGVSSWDGVTKTEPPLVDGAYQISDGEQLAWFRDKVNSDIRYGTTSFDSSSSALCAKLLFDIDLDDNEWIPIGQYREYSNTNRAGYAGTFDGNGKTVSGLKISTLPDLVTANGAHYIGGGGGLFGCLYPGGEVRGLTVDGSIFAPRYSGGIVGYSNGGKISYCVSYVDITVKPTQTGSSSVGGIVGSMTNSTNTPLVEYCVNYGSITGGTGNFYLGGVAGNANYGTIRFCGNEGNVSGGDSVGGVVGSSSATVIGCYNTGNVAGVPSDGVGGIAGYQNNNSLTDCYNTGTVSGGSGNAGGIAGKFRQYAAGKVLERCYNAGSVTSSGASGAIVGAIVDRSGAAAIVGSCYFLGGTAPGGIGSGSNAEDSAISKTGAELRSAEVRAALGSLFDRDLPVPINNGYPILKWQNPDADAIVIDIAPIAGVTAPVAGASASTAVVPTAQYTGTVAWSPDLPASGRFAANTAYTATIALTAKAGYTFYGVGADFFTVAGAVSVANAADSGTLTAVFPATTPPRSITAKIRVQDGFSFLYTSENLTVTESLAAQYGFPKAAGVPQGAITALDVLVAAHIEKYGSAFTTETAANYLKVSSYGSPTAMFGNNETAKFSGFAINHKYPTYADSPGTGSLVADTPVSDGDVIDLFYFEDPMWKDYLTWFADAAGNAIDSLTVNQGAEFTLKVKGFEYMQGYLNPAPEDIYNATADALQVFAVGNEGNILGDIRSAAGIKLIFNATGTYRLTAQGFVNGNGATVIPPYLVVTVVPPEASTDTTVDMAAIQGIAAPVYGETAATAVTSTNQYDGIVSWSPALADGRFAAETSYTATIKLTAAAGYTFDGVAADFFTVAGAASVANAAGSGTVTATFPATGSVPPTTVDIAAIRGIAAPVYGETAATAVTSTNQYAGIVSWAPALVNGRFAANTEYTATIALTAAGGYTFDGVAADFFTVAGAFSVANAAGSGTVTAVFPATGAAMDYTVAMSNALDYIKTTVTSPTFSNIGGEWAILALARGGRADTAYYDGYYSRVLAAIAAIADKDAKLNANLSTDNSRLILAVTALGIDATSVGDKNLVAPLLSDMTWVTKQGMNGAIYALLAVNSGQYATAGDAQSLVDYIVANKAGDGWSISGSSPSTDITAMAIQALAPYYSQPAVQSAIDAALDWLASQNIAGVEANAQMVVALSALGKDAADYGGKNYVAALLNYCDPASGGFVYTSSAVNLMATEQAAYALVAYHRYKTSAPYSLYDMSDAVKLVSDDVVPAKVDKTALAAKISVAEGYVQSLYTEASWSVLVAALADARTVRDSEAATQGEVDAAAGRIDSAISTLTLVGSGEVPLKYVKISVTDPNAGAGQKSVYHPLTQFVMNDNETAYTLLLRTGLVVLTSTNSQYNGAYVVSIDGFGELADGPLSGWMYKVNGESPDYSASLYFLKDGDVVEWVYTRDIGEDIGGGFGYYGGASNVKTPSTTTVKDGAATTVIDDIVVPLGSEPKVYIVTVDTKGEKVNSISAELLVETVKKVADSGSSLKIQSDMAALAFDTDALIAIAGGNAGDMVAKVTAATLDASDGSDPVLELAVTVGGNKMSGFKGTVTITLPYAPPADMPTDDYDLLTVYCLGADGSRREATGAKYDPATGMVTFTASSSSKFIVGEWTNPFRDVSKADSFYRTVRFAYSHGLINGTSPDKFSPTATLSRGMLVTILWRLAQQPTVSSQLSKGGDLSADNSQLFPDVAAGQWYSDAIAWAAANGIVNGFDDGTFRPDAEITLEQLAAILYRYYQWKEGEGKGRGAPEIPESSPATRGFVDADAISGWALDAMMWAAAHVLTTDRAATLAPKSSVTRAETAAILQRFVDNC